MALAIDKLNGLGLSNTHCEHLPKKTKVTWYLLPKDYQVVLTRQSILIIKVSGPMRSDVFKRRLYFSFTVIIST